MKARAIEWTVTEQGTRLNAGNTVATLNSTLRLAARGFMALIPALSLVVASAWLVTAPDLVVYLQATLWASGFVFLGLAIDTEPPANGLSLLSGIALPVLAMLSSRLAVELAIVATALVAAWIAAAIWRR